MVLIFGVGAARCRPHPASDRGSAAVEVALSLPLVVLGVALLVHAAVLGADLVTAHGIAREAARVAAVADDAAVRHAAQRVAGERPLSIDVEPVDAERQPGDLVTATVRLRSAAFTAFGARLDVPARATMMVER